MPIDICFMKNREIVNCKNAYEVQHLLEEMGFTHSVFSVVGLAKIGNKGLRRFRNMFYLRFADES